MSKTIGDTLFVIPARGGSKGIPAKNIKLLGGRPLICYSIDVARDLVPDNQICISTDSLEIISVAESNNLEVPFLRPPELATDSAGTYEVLLHAVNYLRKQDREFETLVLLQPTSPFRTSIHVKEAFDLYCSNIDMVVSVKESKGNPYYNLFEENNDAFLTLSKTGGYTRRQDCPKVYEYNGAVYVININSLRKTPMSQFRKIKKYVMDEFSSIDIDLPEDWLWAEYLIEKGIFKNLHA